MNQMDVTGFLHAGTNSHKLKGDGESDDGALKLPVFKEWTDRGNWFYEYWYRFTKIERWSKFFWVDMSKMGVTSLVTGI